MAPDAATINSTVTEISTDLSILNFAEIHMEYREILAISSSFLCLDYEITSTKFLWDLTLCAYWEKEKKKLYLIKF